MEENKPEGRDFDLQNREKSSNKTVIIALLAIALLAAIGYLVYINQQKAQVEAENDKQQQELQATYYELDSLGGELNDKILEISQLGGDIEELLEIKEQLEKEKKSLQKTSRRQVNNLKDKLSGYKEILAAQDLEITRLKEMNEELLTENTGLKKERNTLNQSIATLNTSKGELEEKVAIASRLKVEDLKIYGVSKSGKEREREFRNRQVEKIKIDFAIAQNPVAPIEGKEIMVQITAPDGNIIFDVSRGSGGFMLDNREVFYTAKKEILYDTKRQQLSVTYIKGSEYMTGLHKVKVYTDGYLMGEGTFVIK